MSSASEPSSPPVAPRSPDAAALAAAAARRTQQSVSSDVKRLQDHEKRQNFRRLIDPGIMRPNNKEVAMNALNTLLKIAENLLREPNNPKFQQFKPTNNIIKRNLMDPKGTLEYAIALGFKPEVIDFQPYYVFQSRKMEDLQIGAQILKDALDLENAKHERAERSMKEEKAAKAAAASNVKMAFMDDRKSKELNDQRERERRAAHAQAAAHPMTSSSSPASPQQSQSGPRRRKMPGHGIMLSGSADPGPDGENINDAVNDENSSVPNMDHDMDELSDVEVEGTPS